MLKRTFYIYLLRKLAKKKCEGMIPRSGYKGKAVNCYSMIVYKDDNPYLLIKDVSGDGECSVLEWNGNRFDIPEVKDICEVMDNELKITHYYGLFDVSFGGIYKCALHRFLRIVYVRIFFHRMADAMNQFFFNRKSFASKNRVELLIFMLGEQVGRTHKGISSFSLMTKLYTERWVLHPERDVQQQLLDIYLESLVKSGDVEIINDEYVVKGEAVQTIEQYQDDERRHIDSVRIAKLMVVLTVLIVLLAIFQAGIIKIKPILDFTITK